MVVASRRRALGALLTGAAGTVLARRGEAAEPPRAALWAWVGALTTNSAVIKARFTTAAGDAVLLVSPNADLSDASRVAATETRPMPDGGEVQTFALTHLDPGRAYSYAVAHGGRQGPAGLVHTMREGPSSFTVAFASCASSGSNNRIFETIERLAPALMIHMGDFHYRNIKENNPGRFLEAFDEVLTSPRQASLYRHVPIAYMWDDHDYGDDDSDSTSRSRPAARAMYDACVPHYPFASSDSAGTIQQAFTMGRVRFLVTDNRSARAPATRPDTLDKSMLGPDQRAWFVRELEAAAHSVPLVVWVNSVPWITKASVKREHGWQPWSTERQWLADRIKALGLNRRLIILSGDGHMVALDDGTNSNYASDAAPSEKAFVVAHAAPLDRYPRKKGGPYTHGMSAKRNQFGVLSVQDDGDTMRVDISGHVRDGSPLPGMRITLGVGPDGYQLLT